MSGRLAACAPRRPPRQRLVARNESWEMVRSTCLPAAWGRQREMGRRPC